MAIGRVLALVQAMTVKRGAGWASELLSWHHTAVGQLPTVG